MRLAIFILIHLLIIPCIGLTQSKLTTQDILKKEMLYNFKAGTIQIIISSDSTIFWRDASKPKEAHEKARTIHVNEHTLMTSWYESDKTVVTLLSDFADLKVFGMVCRADGKFYSIEGTISIKE